jgi:ABC-type Co2+ transport system permease subunit
MTEGLYSSFHPLGTPAPPLLAAQILSMGLTGVMGGWFGTRRVRLSPLRIAQLGAAGFMATLVFAVLTTAAYALTVSLSGSSIVTSLLVGLGFYVVHLASNTLIFCTVVPSVLKALAAVTPSMGGKT